MSNPKNEKPPGGKDRSRPVSPAVFAAGVFDEKHPPSPLAHMMIKKANEALSDGEYAEALDDLLTIKSIEEHADIDTAIAITAMRLIAHLSLDKRARVSTTRLTRYLTDQRNEPTPKRAENLEILRQIFAHERLIELRNAATELESGRLSFQGDGGARNIVSSVTERLLNRPNIRQGDMFQAEQEGPRPLSHEVAAELRRLRDSVDLLVTRQAQSYKQAKLTQLVIFAILATTATVLIVLGLRAF